MSYFEEQDTMRRERSADNRRQGEQVYPQGSQASHVQQLEGLHIPPNPNDVIGTLAGVIRE